MSMEESDRKIREALLKKATGYEYEEKEIVQDKSGKNPKIKVTRKYMPPSIEAIRMIDLMKKTGEWED